jgi:hypothetical protein
MEKKTEFLIQLAKISDLVEKLDYDLKSPTIIFEVSKVEFEKIYDLIEKKFGRSNNFTSSKTFTLKIGVVDFIFNTNSAD